MIVVIGAGVVGTLTAWHLAERGFEVIVVDREGASAMGCSFGNAGIIALGHAEAWGNPAAPLTMARAILGRDPALKVSKFFDPDLWRWGLAFLAQCHPRAFARNSAKLLALSLVSKRELQRISADEGIPYKTETDGTLYIYKDQKQFLHRLHTLESDTSHAEMFKVKTADELVKMEPALAGIKADLVGGIHSLVDETGHCHLFVSQLAEALQASGRVTFRFNFDVEELGLDGRRVTSVRNKNEEISCSGVVIASGAFASSFLRTYGVATYVYPVKGYSVTYDISDPVQAPKYSMLDETELVCVTRLGDQLRFTGFAELAGGDLSLDPGPLGTLQEFARKNYSSAIDPNSAKMWAGSRPATPTSVPYVGKARKYDNMWLNVGHGQLGWTMAAGTGLQIADLIDESQARRFQC